MKKTLLLLLAPFAVTTVFAQCVPGTEFGGTALELAPEVLDPIFACNDCEDYQVEFSVQTLADTVLSIELTPGEPEVDITVFLDFFRLDSIGGLPEGLTYTTDAAFDTTFDEVTNPFGYWINPGDTATGFETTTGCVTISGSAADWTAAIGGGPNNDGIYPLTVFIDARAASFDPLAIGGITGFDVWLTEMGFLLDAFGDPNFTTNGIKLERLALDVRPSGVGVSETNLPVSGVTNYPNPFSGNTTVSFNLSESVEEVTFEVFNVLGTLVYSENVTPRIGKNNILFEGQKHGAGIYFYSLSYDNNTVTKKMILN